jgi:hypothetical protein
LARPRPLILMDLLIPSVSCSSMLLPSARPEVMAASWPIGSRWLQKGKPASGSWVYPRFHRAMEGSL